MRLLIDYKTITVAYDQEGDVPEGQTAQQSSWPFAVYNKLKKDAYADAFKETNQWLSSLDDHTRQRLWRFYENCHTVLMNEKEASSFVSGIRNEVVKIQDIIDANAVHEWNIGAKSFDNVTLTRVSLIKEEELARTTYNDEEAHLLTCFSVAIKILTPIWGTLTESVKNDTGNKWKEREALKIILDTTIAESPAFKKLNGFCHAKAETAQSKVSSTAQAGVTPDALKDGTIATAMIRFLAVYQISSPKNVINSLFQDIENYLSTEARNSFMDKGSGSGGSDEDGLAHDWRRGQETRPSDRAMATQYIKNPELMVRDLKITNATAKDITELAARLLNKPNVMTDLHIHLVGGAMIVDGTPIMSVRLLNTIDDKVAMRVAQAAAYFRYRQLGFIGISNLLISRYTNKDLEDMGHGDVTIKNLDSAKLEMLSELYPLTNANVSARKKYTETPGFKMIEKAVEFAISRDFETSEGFSEIRIELHKLFTEVFV